MSTVADERALVYILRNIADPNNRNVNEQYAADLAKNEASITATYRNELATRDSLSKTSNETSIQQKKSAVDSTIELEKKSTAQAEQELRIREDSEKKSLQKSTEDEAKNCEQRNASYKESAVKKAQIEAESAEQTITIQRNLTGQALKDAQRNATAIAAAYERNRQAIRASEEAAAWDEWRRQNDARNREIEARRQVLQDRIDQIARERAAEEDHLEAQEQYAEREATIQNRMTHALLGQRGVLMGVGSAIRSFALLGTSAEESGEKTMKSIMAFEGVVQAIHAMSRVTLGFTAISQHYREALANETEMLEANVRIRMIQAGATEEETVAEIENVTAANAAALEYDALNATIGVGTVSMLALTVVLGAVAAAHYGEQQAAEAQKKAIEDANKAAEDEIKINQQRLQYLEALATAQEKYAKGITELNARAGKHGTESDLAAATAERERIQGNIHGLDDREAEVKKAAQAERDRLNAQLRSDVFHQGHHDLDMMGHVQDDPNASIPRRLWQGFQGWGGSIKDIIVAAPFSQLLHPLSQTASIGANANTGATSQANFRAGIEATNKKEHDDLEQLAKERNDLEQRELEAVKTEEEVKKRLHDDNIKNLQQEIELAGHAADQAHDAATKERDSLNRDLTRLGAMDEKEKSKLAEGLAQAETGDLSNISGKVIEAILASGLATPEMQKALHGEQVSRGEADPRFAKYVQAREDRAEALEKEANRLRQEEVKAIDRLIAAMANGDPAKTAQLRHQVYTATGINTAALGSGTLGKIELSPLVHIVKVQLETADDKLSKDLQAKLTPIIEKILKDSKAYAELQNDNNSRERNNSITRSGSRSS